MISVIEGALACLRSTLNTLRMVTSLRELLEALFVLQPVKDVLAIMEDMTDFQLVHVLLNIASFQEY